MDEPRLCDSRLGERSTAQWGQRSVVPWRQTPVVQWRQFIHSSLRDGAVRYQMAGGKRASQRAAGEWAGKKQWSSRGLVRNRASHRGVRREDATTETGGGHSCPAL